MALKVVSSAEVAGNSRQLPSSLFCLVLILCFVNYGCGKPQGNIVKGGVGAFYTPDDKLLHAIVVQTGGRITEVYWTDPTKPSITLLVNTGFKDIIAVTGYYSSKDKLRHAVVAESTGVVSDFAYNSNTPGSLKTIGTFTTGHIQAIDAYASNDGFQHIVLATDQKIVFQMRYPDGTPSSVEVLPIGPTYDGIAGFIGVGGFEGSDGKEHVVAITENNVYVSIFSGPASASMSLCSPPSKDNSCPGPKAGCRSAYGFITSTNNSPQVHVPIQARGITGDDGGVSWISSDLQGTGPAQSNSWFVASRTCPLNGYVAIGGNPTWSTFAPAMIAFGTASDSKGTFHGIIGTISGNLYDVPYAQSANAANPVVLGTFTQ